MVILEPGDVLFVPPKWWHFVQSISDDFTISVNTWIDTPADDRMVKPIEALTQIIMALLTNSGSSDVKKFVIDDSTLSIGDDQSIENSLDLLNAVSGTEEEKAENTVMKDFLDKWRLRGVEVQSIKDIDEFCRCLIDNSVLDISQTIDPPAKTSCKNGRFEKMDILKAMTHPDSVRVIYDRLMRMKNTSM